MGITYKIKLLIFLGISFLLIGCSDSGTTQQQLQDASQATNDDGTETSETTPVVGAPLISISHSYGGAAEHFFSLTRQTFWKIDNAKSDLKYCAISMFGDQTACDTESGFSAVPANGIFNSQSNLYELNYDLLTNSLPAGVLQLFMRNGSGVVSNAYSVTIGIVPAVEVSGSVYNGARVRSDFVLRAYGLLEDGAQWRASDIALESPSKCENTAKYEDVDVAGTNWSYDTAQRMLSLSLVHSSLPKTTYKVRFRNKVSGEMSKDIVVVIE